MNNARTIHKAKNARLATALSVQKNSITARAEATNVGMIRIIKVHKAKYLINRVLRTGSASLPLTRLTNLYTKIIAIISPSMNPNREIRAFAV
jgi:hypothetical protein